MSFSKSQIVSVMKAAYRIGVDPYNSANAFAKRLEKRARDTVRRSEYKANRELTV